MTEHTQCLDAKCGARTEGLHKRCPACGGRAQTTRAVRGLGWLLVVVGAALVGLIGMVMFNMAPQLASPGVPTADGSTFTGTVEQAKLITSLFWAIIAFGVVAIANGVWQIRTGRRNMVFFAITIVLAAALVLTARETTQSLDEDATAGVSDPASGRG